MNIPLIVCSVILVTTGAFLSHLWIHRGVLGVSRDSPQHIHAKRLHKASGLALTFGLMGQIISFVPTYMNDAWMAIGWLFLAQTGVSVCNALIVLRHVPWDDTRALSPDTDNNGKDS